MAPIADGDAAVGSLADPRGSGAGCAESLTNWLATRPRATLELADGSMYEGYSFGHQESTAGEVVFNTGMVGYPESLSDPSYAGQILVITFPLIGNYGVPEEDRDELGLLRNFESDKIHVKAVVVHEYSFIASHYTAYQTLGQWLKKHKIPGLYGVDTRQLTKLIRNHGSILGKLGVQGSTPLSSVPFDDPNERNLAAEVSRKKKEEFKAEDASYTHILAIDCGMKHNIIRYMVNVLKVKLTVVPWTTTSPTISLTVSLSVTDLAIQRNAQRRSSM